jgi:hypothetical protein
MGGNMYLIKHCGYRALGCSRRGNSGNTYGEKPVTDSLIDR